MNDTDAATFTALLGELREVDFETWKDIRFLLSNSMMFPEPREIPLEQHIYHDIIQGCIQRACEHQKWIWHHGHGPEMGYVATVNHGNIIKGDTPAAAILAAYIEAVRARQ